MLPLAPALNPDLEYRTYCEHKRFKKNEQAAACIQAYYRNYRNCRQTTQGRKEKEGTPTSGLK